MNISITCFSSNTSGERLNFPETQYSTFAELEELELLSSHESDHHTETCQWVVSLQLLNRAVRQSFGRELQKPCSEPSMGSRWNSATLELLCSSASLVRRMFQRGPLCSALLLFPVAPTLRSKRSCVSVTEGSSCKKQDDWRKRKIDLEA